MNFTYVPQLAASRDRDGPAFTVRQLWRRQKGRQVDLSDRFDRTYAYGSPRELRWYLAEKYGVPVDEVKLHRG